MKLLLLALLAAPACATTCADQVESVGHITGLSLEAKEQLILDCENADPYPVQTEASTKDTTKEDATKASMVRHSWLLYLTTLL